jgi:ubiquinone/menaquinone biosynthesis C-methylase UbiE
MGGATGVYAFPLAKKGYTVHLIDPMPLHIEHVTVIAAKHPQHPLGSITLGDASHIAMADTQVDAVLLFGPLYHLTDRMDRLQALREAYRVLKPGGIVFAVGISQFASLLDGLLQGFITDPQFVQIIHRNLRDGQHRNPTMNPQYFTTAYFHKPNELKREVKEAGFQGIQLFAVEGPLWMTSNFEQYWENCTLRQQLLSLLETLETEPSVMGASTYLLAIGFKP